MPGDGKETGRARGVHQRADVTRERERVNAAVIFDHDGVLVNSEPFFQQSTLAMWRRRKLRIPSDYVRFVRERILGTSETETFERFKRLFRLSDSVPSLIVERQRLFDAFSHERIKLLPGARSLVHQLEGRYSLAVASSSPARRVKGDLRRLSLNRFFPVIITADMLRGRSKPDPAIYRLAAQRLRILPSRCIVVEDAPNGVIAAKRAGMACIALKHRTVPRRSLRRADVIVTSLNQITPRLIRGFIPA